MKDVSKEVQAEGCVKEATEQIARTNMALLHFIMTIPKWSISLFLFLAARQRPIPTFQHGVQQPIHVLRSAFDAESDAYKECVRNSAVTLQKELQHAAKIEFDRLEKIHEGNQVKIEHLRMKKEQCLTAATKARNLLIDWQDHGNIVGVVEDGQICSYDDRQALTDLLGGEVQLLEQEASSVWSRQVRESLSGLRAVQEYANVRFQYDYDYFVGLRIDPALDLLANYSAIDLSFFTLNEISIRNQVDTVIAKLREALSRVEEVIQVLRERIAEMSFSLQEFYVAYSNLYDRFLKGVLFMEDFLPPGVPLPAFFDMSGLPIADSLMPPSIDMFIPNPDLASIYLLLDQAAEACFQIIKEVIYDLEEKTSRALRGAINRLSEVLSSLLTLEDYDPPKFVGTHPNISSFDQQYVFQENMGQASLNETKRLLGRLLSFEAKDREQIPTKSTVNNHSDTFSEGSTTFSYLRPLFPSLFVPKLIAWLFSALASFTWLFEVCIQAMRLWRLETSYSKAAVPDLPTISYDEKEESNDQPKTRDVLHRMIWKTLLTPRLIFAAMLVPILLGVVALWYPHVRNSCKTTQDGTFLANRFIAPIFMNEANAEGNVHFLKTELQCYRTQREICQQMRAQTIARYQLDYSIFMELLSDHKQTEHVVDIIDSCIDANTTSEITDSCCGIKGFAPCTSASSPGYCPVDVTQAIPMAFHQISNYVNEPACSVAETALIEPSFACENLQSICESIPCNGVDEQSLQELTVETDCQIQLYGVDFFYFLLLTIFHAVFINAISSLLFTGVRNASWRRIAPDGIQFRARLEEDGNLATGDDQEDRAQRIAVAIGRFERAGKIQIFLGSLLFLAWSVVSFV